MGKCPGSAPGVGRGRWQYCPMRALRLCGLTLAVVLAHLAGWRLAAGAPPAATDGQAGVRWIALARPSPRQAGTPQAGPKPSADEPAVPAPALASPRARVPIASGAGAGDPGAPGSQRPGAWPVYPTHAPPSIAVHYA